MSAFTDSSSTDDPRKLDDYQPFPMMSVVVFVIALIAGSLALVNPKLFGVPLLAAVLSLITLIIFHVRKRSGQAIMFVAAALAFSLFCFAFRVTYQKLRTAHLKKTAIAHAETWLGLIKDGKSLDALEMSVDRRTRQKPGTDLTRIYGTPENPGKELKQYLQMEPERTIRRLGKDAEIEMFKVEYAQPHNRHDLFAIHCRLKRGNNEDEDYLFNLALLRIRPLEGDVFWEMKKLNPVRPRFPRAVRGIGVFGGTQGSEIIE